MPRTAISSESTEPIDEAALSETRSGSRQRLWGWTALLALLAVLVYTLPVGHWLTLLSHYVEGLGFWGPVAFVGITAITTILLVPGTILTAAAGVIFDTWTGIASVSLGLTLGAAVSFWLGRYMARDHVEEWVRKRPKFRAVDDAVAGEGWKIVFLLRLSPLFPFNFLNYAFGLTKVRFWTYLTASLLGVLPGTAIYVLGGSAAAELLKRSQFDWSLLVGIIAVVLGTIWTARAAWKAVQKVK
jgi:uncharacterized membrane protein YdjX (TVP38/TMEM64 family)